MKGLELPINTLIIIVLAVIVLVAIIFLFYSGILMPQQSISKEAILRAACLKMSNSNCNINPQDIQIEDFDADGDKNLDPGPGIFPICSEAAAQDNLLMLCRCQYQIEWVATMFQDCKKLCGCP